MLPYYGEVSYENCVSTSGERIRSRLDESEKERWRQSSLVVEAQEVLSSREAEVARVTATARQVRADKPYNITHF